MQQGAFAIPDGYREMAVPHFARSLDHSEERPGRISLSRWINTHSSARHVLETDDDEYVVTIYLQSTRIELRCGAACLFDGVFGGGTAHITGPSRYVEASARGPCDLLHLHIRSGLLQARLRSDLDGRTVQDPLIGQLGYLLLSAKTLDDDAYEGSVVYTLLTRVLWLARECPKIGTLPKWRLRRVQDFIDQNLSDPLKLNDLAAAAGLSRMYFATLFRAATGCSPHHYLLCQRIEAAKQLLADSDLPLVEIALSVGFMAQAHFTTVFKRLTGETPARWRRLRRDTAAGVF